MKKFLLLALLTSGMLSAQITGQTIIDNSEKIKVFSETSLSTAKKVTSDLKESSKNATTGVATVYGDSKDATKTVYSDSKELVKELYADGKSLGLKLEDGLKSLAQGLKTTSIKAWEILVLQQRVWSLCYLSVTILSLIISYRFTKQFGKMQTDVTETGDVKESNITMTIILGLVSVSLLIASMLHFEKMVTGFVNPEFGAIRTLFEIIQTLR